VQPLFALKPKVGWYDGVICYYDGSFSTGMPVCLQLPGPLYAKDP